MFERALISEGRSLKRFGALLLIVLGFIVIVVSVLFTFYNALISNPKAASLPHTLADQSLRIAVYGEEAIDQVVQLHGKRFALISGGVGTYGNQDEVTLWVTGTIFSRSAQEMVEAMQEKIEQNETPFQPVGILNHAGHSVRKLSGMGQQHFYFQAGALVVWLAADPYLAEDALDDAMQFFP